MQENNKGISEYLSNVIVMVDGDDLKSMTGWWPPRDQGNVWQQPVARSFSAEPQALLLLRQIF